VASDDEGGGVIVLRSGGCWGIRWCRAFEHGACRLVRSDLACEVIAMRDVMKAPGDNESSHPF
jgi:hypothetical protein